MGYTCDSKKFLALHNKAFTSRGSLKNRLDGSRAVTANKINLVHVEAQPI